MKITHSKLYQHIEVPDIDYSQYEQIADGIYTYMPTKIVSAQYRKNMSTGFFVMVNEAVTNKILALFTDPPKSLIPDTDASKEAKMMSKKSTKAKQ